MERDASYWEDVLKQFEKLTVYRALLRDPVIKAFRKLCRALALGGEKKDITAVYHRFLTVLIANAERLGLRGHIFREYIIHLFINDENMLSLACERNTPVWKSTLYQLAQRDAQVLMYLCELDISELNKRAGNDAVLSDFIPLRDKEDPDLMEVENAKNSEAMLKVLITRYQQKGAGEMARFGMFKLGKRARLIGIPRADTVTFNDIVGCQCQKETLIRNTEDFLAGLPANNVLLAGSRGNGKSSCVKALINEYADKGLRLIEASKDQTRLLPELMNQLSARGKHFIILMDDLSFEQFETQYKYLKSILEGGAEAKPKNVLFYATSNRRHIVRESFGDRAEATLDEEVHTTDTLNEKLSLSDRFGITITFPNLNQQEYVNIVRELASRRHLDLDPSYLTAQAVKWSIVQKSVSGRTARQFVDHIAGEITRL